MTRLICARCRRPLALRPFGGWWCERGCEGDWVWLAEDEEVPVERQGELFE